MGTLDAFAASPMARHPRLLLRKVCDRLARRTHSTLQVQPPLGQSQFALPPWAAGLRTWLSRVPLDPAPHPFNQVFGLRFPDLSLRRLCQYGPVPGQRGLEADIKLVWDYSRGHALVTNAAANKTTLDDCANFLRYWLESNGDLNGPAWTSGMDVAIRAVNWLAADALFEGALGRRLGEVAWRDWLWRHGFVTWRRLEFHLVSSNHYFANLLGLAAVGSAFPDDPEARSWREFAGEDFPRALLAQTRRDGGLNEASLRYHAFVTEMALLFRLIQGAPFPPEAEQRLRAMCQIVADFRDASGDVFAFGDDDSGRVLAIDSASKLGRAEILLRLAATVLGEEFQTAAAAICPESGWWVNRAGDFALALDFGGAGLWGRGSHAHNDDFSICLDWRNRAVIVDPGTYLYTSDIEARNQFRSTLSHNTVIVDGQEQHKLTGEPFRLPHADAAFPAEKAADGAWTFSRSLAGNVRHTRKTFAGVEGIRIRDRFEGPGRHRFEWRFHLHPAVAAKIEDGGFLLELKDAGSLRLAATGMTLDLGVRPAEFSPGYGRKEATRVCVARGEASLPCAVDWPVRLQ